MTEEWETLYGVASDMVSVLRVAISEVELKDRRSAQDRLHTIHIAADLLEHVLTLLDEATQERPPQELLAVTSLSAYRLARMSRSD